MTVWPSGVISRDSQARPEGTGNTGRLSATRLVPGLVVSSVLTVWCAAKDGYVNASVRPSPSQVRLSRLSGSSVAPAGELGTGWVKVRSALPVASDKVRREMGQG